MGTNGQRRRVYFNEYNVLMEGTAYLPIVSGLLRAHAETFDLLKQSYEFMPFFFYRDIPQRILPHYDNPSVAAFSVSMWNEQLNLQIAEAVKRKFPDCLIVFGGPHVPHHPEEYFKEHSFVDVAVRGEGEESFSEILIRNLEARDFSGISGVAWREPATGRCVRNETERAQPKDLDMYPSPYLEHLFDDLMNNTEEMSFQAIIETNRGCPFPCAFCFWGQGGLSLRYRFHGIDRVGRELEWCAQHKIKYVFNADSNFGMHQRDREIAQILVDIKKKYGYPEKFRTCFGKNTDDKIYEIACLLHSNDLEKGITLARQSNNEDVLRNIRRQNIKLSTYENLQIRFNEREIPVYTELILGLPGENMDTWIQGIDDILKSGLKNQLFVYHCQIYPNTEMADPEYQKKFGIVTRRIQLMEIHGAVRPKEIVTEFEDIVVSTDSMPVKEWRRMAVFSWMMMVLHSLKIAFFVMLYLVDRFGIKFTDFLKYVSDREMPPDAGGMLRAEANEFYSQADRLLDGHGRGRVLPDYGSIYWDEEEASFLRISEKLDVFYREMLSVVCGFLEKRGVDFDREEVAEAVHYQRMRIPSANDPATRTVLFSWNFPEFFEKRLTSNPVPFEKRAQLMEVMSVPYEGDRPLFARKTILWGRKSGTMMTKVKWANCERAEPAVV